MKLLRRGSTKDVYQKGEYYVFSFSDRYSVFDWGEMPDLIKDKGRSLARFNREIYLFLEGKSFKTHLVEVLCAENEMVITPFEVNAQHPLPAKENIFIPLEVIFRLGVARGSSLPERSPEFKELQMFSVPLIEFTTKLERIDRELSHHDARSLSGTNDVEWQNLLSITARISLELQGYFHAKGITLWDGKLEFALGKYVKGNREIILVDSIGPDELRLSSGEALLSKEVIRQFYQSDPWYLKLKQVKKAHGVDFKNHIEQPRKMPENFLRSVESLYGVLPDILCDVPGAQDLLNQTILELQEYQV